MTNNQKSQELALKCLTNAITQTVTALVYIQKANTGAQFDYVTSPALSDKVNELISLINKIEKITYQK